MVWYGMVWYGMVWCGVVWHDENNEQGRWEIPGLKKPAN